uniref:C2H2-type domain-containing protein n=1 Tax=Anopheles atroparvus TaxID=41427 RepID=A0AAG5DIY9_ANOAO
MSRRKQAKPRAVKHEGDEEDVDGGTTSTGANSKRNVSGEDKSDSPMADVSDDDREDDEDEVEEECDDEGSVSVKAPVVGVIRGRSEGENSETSASDQQVVMVKSCGKALGAVEAGPSVCANVVRGDKREDTVEANRVDRTLGNLGGKVQATDTNAIKCEPQLRNESIHSGELLLAGEPSEVANVSDEEDIDDDEDEVDDGTEDDGNDDGDNLDVDDEEDDDDELPIDGEEDDVDDELTSDSFCSELYSSHTSSSFSPSISDGMATPNSITNDTNDSSLLTLEPGGGSEKSFRQVAGLHPHHHLPHPHHVARHHHHHHHVHHRRMAGATKEAGKSSSKNHSTSSNNNNNNNNSSNHNNNNNNNNHSGNSNSKSLTSTYHCQFCEKTFPRLGYLKKHEQ